MTTYAAPGSAHSSQRILPSRGVDGKPTTVSDWNASKRTSLPAEGFTLLVPFHHGCPQTLQHRWFASLRSPTLTKSTRLTLPKGISPTTLSRLAGNSLNIHGLQRIANRIGRIGIDKIGPWAYKGIQKGRSRCSYLAAKTRTWVPGALVNHGRELGS